MYTDKLYIKNENFFKFLNGLKKDYDVFVPVKKLEQRFYKKYDSPSNDIVIGEVRTFEPAKAFFSPARETVAEGFKNTSPKTNEKPVANGLRHSWGWPFPPPFEKVGYLKVRSPPRSTFPRQRCVAEPCSQILANSATGRSSTATGCPRWRPLRPPYW